MPLADSEGLGAAEQRESRRGALRMCGDRNGVHGLLGQEPERRGNPTKEQGWVTRVLKYQGVGWGLFENIRDPKYLSAVDFNFRQNLMESDCIKLVTSRGSWVIAGMGVWNPRLLDL